jgi:hypothetical protein
LIKELAMFGSRVLEMAIGLSFCYASLALIVSTVQEALASLFKLRANSLLAGVKAMLGDPQCTGLAGALYRHALVNPHADSGRPSYIDPQHFALALVDTLANVPGDLASVKSAIDAMADAPLRRALQALYERADGDMRRFQEGIAGWFDTTMERLSGSYKRRASIISVLLSLLLAILLNIDSIHLFRTLWLQPAMAAQLGSLPAALDGAALDALTSLPIGWENFPPQLDQRFLLQCAGWLITAATALFGAPFWFDLLQRTVQMRGTGATPAERRATALKP